LTHSAPPGLVVVPFRADPYPVYARLRADAPVHRTILPDGQPGWLVTRYEAAVAVLQDDRFGKNPAEAKTPEQLARLPWKPGVFEPLNLRIASLDPPDHTRLRALVHRAFTPLATKRLRERIREVCDELLDAAERAGGIDIVADYARPLPAIMTAELLGIPLNDVDRWSNIYRYHQGWSDGDVLSALREQWEFLCYLRELFERRRDQPGDDLISALVRVHVADASALSEDELLAMVTLLFESGQITTLKLIGSGMLALLDHPDQIDLLRRNPSLIESAVEELLRYTHPPGLGTHRYPREDVAIDGVTIPRGEMVVVVLGSANRDERQFEDPDTLDITRQPNEHVAFGRGRHYCLGAALARLEGQIAINTLLARMPDLGLAQAPEPLSWHGAELLRGL
jgi:cytochrome P450